MRKNRVLISLVLISLVNFLIQQSDGKLCADTSCKSVIATGITAVRSSPKAKGHLGFPPNVPVKIFARKVGPNEDLLLVEIQGRVGVVWKKHIIEKKIIVRSEELIEVSEPPEKEENEEIIKSSIQEIKTTITESLPQVKPSQHIMTDISNSSNVSREDVSSTEATPVLKDEKVVHGTQIPIELDAQTDPITDGSSAVEEKTSAEEESNSTSLLEEMKVTARHLLYEDDESVESNSEEKKEDEFVKETAESKEETETKSTTLDDESEKDEMVIENPAVTREVNNANDTGEASNEENANELNNLAASEHNTLVEKSELVGMVPEDSESEGKVKEPEVPISHAQIQEQTDSEEVPKLQIQSRSSTMEGELHEHSSPNLHSVTHIPPTHDDHTPPAEFEDTTTTPNPIETVPTTSPSFEQKSLYSHFHHHEHDHEHHNPENSSKPVPESISSQQVDERTETESQLTSQPPFNERNFDSDANDNNLMADSVTENKISVDTTEKDTNENLEDTSINQSSTHTHELDSKPEGQEKVIHESSIDSNHMLPPLMRRHGNQKQEISRKEVEVKSIPGEVVESAKVEVEVEAGPGFVSNILSFASSLWFASTAPSKEEKILESFSTVSDPEDKGFCEKLGPNECPKLNVSPVQSTFERTCSFPKNFAVSAVHKVLENINLLAVTAIAGIIVLLLIMCYNCMSNCQRESELIAKLNKTERDLLASMKELDIAKSDLTGTQSKLSSIEDNSFGSNDMVMALKQDLEAINFEKQQLIQQIENMEKELDTATEAGLELNKIIAELLSAQNGDENIVSSVEELQIQLNEQQATILDINSILAQKSRENSELQILLAETNAKYVGEIESLKTDNEELENERSMMQSKLEEIKQGFEHDISAALESKNSEIRLLQNEILQLKPRYDEVYTNWQTCEAKIEALQESLKQVKLDGSGKFSEVLNIANVKAEISALKKENDILKERLESQQDSKKSVTEQLKAVTEEIGKIKQDFHQAEKDKLEAQTRLEVLSNYFKEKETQLQKELSVKEALWLKQQGETTTTVERVKNMQEEIQSLKSQNDSLRAEIEAQSAAHKAQIGTLENRAHETWLSARQSERKYEEARLEGANLRRKLTQLSQNGLQQSSTDGIPSSSSAIIASSPIHVENPGSPIMQLPPPPFLPPSFMGLPPPPPMMVPGGGGPPPPFPSMFLPPGEIRPPPLGRLMSPPPPPHHRYIDDGNSVLDDDFDDEYDDYDEERRSRVYARNGRYTPDSRYDYNSRYDTETDFSPPPSPTSTTRSEDGMRRNGYRDRRSGGSQRSGNNGLNDSSGRGKSKGLISSGSEKSFSSRRSKGHNV